MAGPDIKLFVCVKEITTTVASNEDLSTQHDAIVCYVIRVFNLEPQNASK